MTTDVSAIPKQCWMPGASYRAAGDQSIPRDQKSCSLMSAENDSYGSRLLCVHPRRAESLAPLIFTPHSQWVGPPALVGIFPSRWIFSGTALTSRGVPRPTITGSHAHFFFMAALTCPSISISLLCMCSDTFQQSPVTHALPLHPCITFPQS